MCGDDNRVVDNGAMTPERDTGDAANDLHASFEDEKDEIELRMRGREESIE